MATVIDNVIHGGELVVIVKGRYGSSIPREFWPAMEAEAVAEARKLPWAPKKIEARQEQDRQTYHANAVVRLTPPARVRASLIRERIEDAVNTRCACGSYGSWEDGVSGTSGNHSCVWAGCPNCGSAVGRPLRSADLAWYERQGRKVIAR